MHRTIKLLIAVIGVIATVAGAAVAATTPGVSTGKATSIHDVSAVLNGTVNPNGTTSVYHFEWGLTTAYGVTSSLKSAGSGTKPVAVKTTAGGLIPGTVYHYRLSALSKSGGSALGTDRTFKTSGNPPRRFVELGRPRRSASTPRPSPASSTRTTRRRTGTSPVRPDDRSTRRPPPCRRLPTTKLVLPVSAQLTGLQAGCDLPFPARRRAQQLGAPVWRRSDIRHPPVAAAQAAGARQDDARA